MTSSRIVLALLVRRLRSRRLQGRVRRRVQGIREGSDEFCECMADKADANLNDEQKEYVLAGIRGDEARAAQLQEEMGMENMEQVGAFMAGAFECGAAEAERQGT